MNPGHQRSPHPLPRAQQGYTLMELLVTIAIMVVLIALLFVGLQTAQAGADRAKCTSNLRQIGAAIHVYSSENNGWLPPGSRSNMGGTFSRILSEYMHQPMKSQTMAADVFYCPANVRLESPPALGYASGGQPNGYKGWSGYFFNYCLNASIFKISNSDTNNSGYVSDNEGRVRLASILLPSKTLALVDMHTRAPGVSGPPTSGMAKKTYFDPSNASFTMGAVHSGKGNVLFVDGHVETFTGTQPLPVCSLPNQETPWWP